MSVQASDPRPAREPEERRARQAVIVVAGMHRSGTSATGGVLQALGISLPGQLLEGKDDNPKGFFENERIVLFHEALLHRIGSAYDEPLALTEDELRQARIDGAVDDLAHILREEIADRELSAFKDPRACRLLPIWTEATTAIGVEMLVAVPLRDPSEVAASLSRRNGFSDAQGLVLWLDHVLAAELHSRRHRRSFFEYASLLDNWRNVTSRISRDLEIRYPRDRHAAADEIDGFLTLELRHHSATSEFEGRDDLRHAVGEAWKALLALCDRPYDDDALAVLDRIRLQVSSSETIFREFVRSNRLLLDERSSKITYLEEYAVEVGRVLAEKDRQAAEQRSNSESELAAFSRKLGARRHTIGRVTRDLDAAKRELSSTQYSIGGIERDLAASLRTGDRLRQDLELSRGDVLIAEAKLQALLASNAWRMTRAALRVMGMVPTPVRRAAKRTLRFLRRSIVRTGTPPADPIDPPSDMPIDRPEAERKSFLATPEDYRAASTIESSTLFDPTTYQGSPEAEELGLPPSLHYVLLGEPKGYSPSSKFDPQFYGLMYPDIETAGINKLDHYITNGATEGRRPISPAGQIHLPNVELNSDRPIVLVIAHEASRTGAPILAWNIIRHLKTEHNVLTLILGPGELEANFAAEADVMIGPLDRAMAQNPIDARYIVGRILDGYSIDFVIANSVETRVYAVEFARRMIPVVTLVHEFASYIRPNGILGELFSMSDELVFSAEIVRRMSEKEYPLLADRRVRILPQGQSIIPEDLENDDAPDRRASVIREEGIAENSRNKVVVVGLGTVQHRKGVDLFISAAAVAVKLRPEIDFLFLWYGHGYRPDVDVHYSAYLEAQIEIMGLRECLEIRDPVADLSSVYQQADILALTSRLDPLPNVAIDAAIAEIPVVCFEGASGFAGIMQADESTAQLVLPHLDSSAAGHLLAELAGDSARRYRLGHATGQLAKRTFRMEEYVASLADIGRGWIERGAQKQRDAELIRDVEAFDPEFYRGDTFRHLDDRQALAHYLSYAVNVDALANPESDFQPRRPVPGFHPLQFARDGLKCGRRADKDPLAEFVRMGSPDGPWSYPVLTPASMQSSSGHSLATALHGHFHYHELVPELLAALSKNRMQCDLFLTVTHPEAVAATEAAAERYEGGDVTVRLVPNRGRDIGPFLTEFASEAAAYEVIGHIHGKRSAQLEGQSVGYGSRWRDFLWQHLVGPEHAMADVIQDQMASNPSLGLVFPEDPHLVGWNANRGIAQDLAGRLGMTETLPDFFSFPVGTMFWARREAIQPLFDLGLTWDDYPEEPLAEDGTILHAIERLIPHVVANRGFSMAATHIAGITR